MGNRENIPRIPLHRGILKGAGIMLTELVEKLLDTGRKLSGIETVFEDSIRIVKRVNGEIRQYAVEDRRKEIGRASCRERV